MFNPLQSARDLTRLYEIGSVLARYGFGGVVKALGLSRALSRFRRGRRAEARELTELELPERARRVLEELGPTFIKLGQVLATRLDLLGREWIDELQRLQRHSPPVEYRTLRAQLTEDQGAPPEEVFAAIDEQPCAAASIAQTHRARTRDGDEVILKIRRPGIERTIDSDLRLLEHLAELAEAQLPELRRYRPSALVRQFAASLRPRAGLFHRGAQHGAHRRPVGGRLDYRGAQGLPPVERRAAVGGRVHRRYSRSRRGGAGRSGAGWRTDRPPRGA